MRDEPSIKLMCTNIFLKIPKRVLFDYDSRTMVMEVESR